MILIDTNIFISYMNENDSKHKEAVSVIEKIYKENYGRPFISDYIFSEIVTVASVRVNRKEAIFAGNSLINNMLIIKITEKIFNDSWILFCEDNKFSFTDCTNLAIMKEFGVNKIATFDKEFAKI